MFIFTLPQFGFFEAWRGQARALAGSRVPAHEVTWKRTTEEKDLFAGSDEQPLPKADQSVSVPKLFLNLAETAVCHASIEIFAALYRLLLKLCDRPDVLSNPADPDVARVSSMAKEVRRDAHKMKAFVRFKEISEADYSRRQFASWFEPDHHIVEHTAGFFVRRFADMDWVISTPKGNASFLKSELSFSPFSGLPPPSRDTTDDLWRTYYANIFNPSRLKIKAMQSEMPKKYWKNLPEAELIPGLIREAEARMAGMRRAAATPVPAHLSKIKAPTVQEPPVPDQFSNLKDLHAASRNCRRCELCRFATQTVNGEGPETASIMFVGEQPGDQEDLSGKPFVGPAGQLFDDALAQTGLARSASYITNAVKHFKFQPRGKRRIHQKPNAQEISLCRWWLSQELMVVKPKVIVAMGATALQSLTGDGSGISTRRGSVETMAGETKLVITNHPSAILRAFSQERATELKQHFFADMSLAAEQISVLKNT